MISNMGWKKILIITVLITPFLLLTAQTPALALVQLQPPIVVDVTTKARSSGARFIPFSDPFETNTTCASLRSSSQASSLSSIRPISMFRANLSASSARTVAVNPTSSMPCAGCSASHALQNSVANRCRTSSSTVPRNASRLAGPASNLCSTTPKAALPASGASTLKSLSSVS